MPSRVSTIAVFGLLGLQLLADEFGHLFPKGMVFEVSELACIKIHAVLSADFVTNVWLISVLHVLHLLPTDRAVNVCDFIISLADLDIPAI